MTLLYSPLKFFNFPDRLEALRRGTLAAPAHVRIKPTNKCNHGCWYCAYRTDDLKLGEDMDERDAIPPAKMAEIVDRNETITRHIWDRGDAVAHFKEAGERFKAEWIGELPP